MDRSADWASCFIYVLHDQCNLRARLRRRFNWRRRRLVFSCFPVIAWNKKEVIFWIKKMLSFFCSSDSWCFNLLPQSFWDSKGLRCQKLRRCFNGYQCNGCSTEVFLHIFLLPAFLQLVFQPLLSAQTGFLIAAWEPSGLDYWSLIYHCLSNTPKI